VTLYLCSVRVLPVEQAQTLWPTSVLPLLKYLCSHTRVEISIAWTPQAKELKCLSGSSSQWQPVPPIWNRTDLHPYVRKISCGHQSRRGHLPMTSSLRRCALSLTRGRNASLLRSRLAISVRLYHWNSFLTTCAFTGKYSARSGRPSTCSLHSPTRGTPPDRAPHSLYTT
jgi:hypothetical protein